MGCEIIKNATEVANGKLSFNVSTLENGWGVRVTGNGTPGEQKKWLAHCVLTNAIRQVGNGKMGTEETLTEMPCPQCGKCINANVLNTGKST